VIGWAPDALAIGVAGVARIYQEASMGFCFGKASLAKLDGVHPDLVRVFKRAITISRQDFSIHDGLRTIEQQRALVNRGASQTMKSMHLPQADGLGHAGDAVPYINGQLRWEWGPIYDIAAAMAEAARIEKVRVRWGGCWDRVLNDLGATADDMRKAVAGYCARHPGPDFIDGPHFELLP